ncbi:MAG: RluA family pseudouridine synthase, partial [Anaerolineales bacterium]
IYPYDEPQRLDKFLVDYLEEFSRARIQQFIKSGLILIDQKPARKSGQTLEKGMEISVGIPPIAPSELVPENIPLDIIYENDDLMVINKPAGMVVHPSVGHKSGTLVHAALAHASELEGVGGVHRPGIVHRLDKDTSGIILLAKNDQTHQFLTDQFRNRQVKKVYVALVDGHPPTPDGKVDAAIGRDPNHRKRMTVTSENKGRVAVSEYHTIQHYAEHALLEVQPLTGRTHQIRVHLAFLQCPIVGDTIYGRRKPSLPINRHFLHAYKLTITIPGEDVPHLFTAELPGELTKIIDLIS